MNNELIMKIKMAKSEIARLKRDLAYHKCKIKLTVKELEEIKEELRQLTSDHYIY